MYHIWIQWLQLSVARLRRDQNILRAYLSRIFVNTAELRELIFFFWGEEVRESEVAIEEGGGRSSGQSVYFWTVMLWSGKNINIDCSPSPSPEEIMEANNIFELWAVLARASRGPQARFLFSTPSLKSHLLCLSWVMLSAFGLLHGDIYPG